MRSSRHMKAHAVRWVAVTVALVMPLMAACTGRREPATTPQRTADTQPDTASASESVYADALPLPSSLAGGELPALRSRVVELLVVEPPAETLPPDAESDPRLRPKIEAYFETLQRWQDAHLLEVTELLGDLMALEDEPVGNGVRHALAALLLEDQAALGFGHQGNHAAPEVGPEQLAAALARHAVDFTALAAGAYRRCADSLRGQPTLLPEVLALCVDGAERMALRGRALPRCASPLLTAQTEPVAGHPGPEDADPQEGLVLAAAHGVPLLDAELQRVASATQQRMAQLLGRPLPLARPQGAKHQCAREPRPSDALFLEQPATRWRGLFLHCDDGSCGVTVCATSEPSCFRADLEGDASKVGTWLAAVERLQRAGQGPTLVEPDAPGSARSGVVHALRAMHGPWAQPDAVQAELARRMPALLRCQGQSRYESEWTVAVDTRGRVSGLRPATTRGSYPMDDRAVLSDAQTACTEATLRELRFAPTTAGGPRRLLLSVHIPAALQVDLPLTLGAESAGDYTLAVETLARDASAVRLARCFAAATDRDLEAVGICAQVDGQGRVGGLTLDAQPLSLRRVRERLDGVDGPVSMADAGPTVACVAEVLSELPWGCHGPGAARQVALTVRLPRGLLQRAAPDDATRRP